VVVDDALMGITEVVRGRDLLLSSPQQMYVAQLLGFSTPRFIHLPLLCNEEGQRLSKRDKSLDMESLRQQCTAPELIGHLAFLAGLQPEPQPATPESLVGTFDWSKVPLNDIIAPTPLPY
jgi:glutamyl-tRNA synthetase